MKNRIIISCVVLILLAAGCMDENDLKIPVETNLAIRIFPLEMGAYSGFDEIGIWASASQIGIQRIEFEGMREVGDDLFFVSDPEIDLFASQFYDQAAAISYFYLPQGIYNFIRLDLLLKTINPEDLISQDETDALDAGFIIKGSYRHIWWRTNYLEPDSVHLIPFVFIVDSEEKFIFRSAEDVVIKQPDCHMLISFDLDKAFQSIDWQTFEEAEKIVDGRQQKVIISTTKNRDLYESFLYRLGMSTKIYVH